MSKKIVSLVLLFIWLGVIFSFSAQSGLESSELSNDFLVIVQRFLPFSSYLVRKLAHFTEFLILGLLVVNVGNSFGYHGKKVLMFCFLFCFLYACSDELHQMFIDGRVPAVFDVLVDSLGSLGGIIIYNWCICRKDR